MAQVTNVSASREAQATKELAKKGAAIEAAFIAGEFFVAALGGYATATNSTVVSDKPLSQSWDGIARIAVGAGSLAAAGDAARRTKRLYENVKALS